MLTGVHFLLTYQCTSECDHCFLYCSPRSEGTFTVTKLHAAFRQIDRVSSIKTVYFEGGEPFLFHPLLIAGAKMANERSLAVGIVTNSYWATSVEDALLWLQPLKNLGVADLSLSDDAFHNGDENTTNPRHAELAALRLGIPVSRICIDPPKVSEGCSPEHKGEPVVGGDVCFRGRAADILTAGLPTRPWRVFTQCSREELENPKRVHVDAFGNVQVCQGLSIGNMWEMPLKEIINTYDARTHPICGPLLRGGPTELALATDVSVAEGYVDECHLCYDIRRDLLDRYPQYLGPRQVYGIESAAE